MKSLFSKEIVLEDVNKLQEIELDATKIGNDMGFGGLFRITIQDTYAGADYPNMAVSEVEVRLKEFDLPIVRFESDSGDNPSHMVAGMIDGNRRTFWSAAASGASFTLSSSGYGVSSVGIQAGPRTHARAKKIKVTANNRSMTYDMENNEKMQFLKVPSITGYTGSAWGEIEVSILEVYPGSTDDAEVAVNEITVRATNYDGF
jgi:hypothetical protein